MKNISRARSWMIIPLLFLGIISFAQKQKKMHIIKVFHINGQGGWDYLKTCPSNNNLYVSHGIRVHILDKYTGDSVGIIENTIGVHGIAFDVKSQQGFISNGKLNTVTAFDLKTNMVLGEIKTGLNPDAIMLEPFSGKIITCNGKSKSLSIIDPSTNQLVDSIDVGGKPEEAVSSEDGILYVNLEDQNKIVQIDIKTYTVLQSWSLAPGIGPTGLAIDKATHRLFVGCDKLLMVVDATNGNLIQSLPIGEGCDGVVFDPNTQTIYTSNGEGTVTAIQEKNPNHFKRVDTIKTKPGARTIAFDPKTQQLYLPTADFDMIDLNKKLKPKMLAGSFQILVLGNK